LMLASSTISISTLQMGYDHQAYLGKLALRCKITLRALESLISGIPRSHTKAEMVQLGS
jgi:hypothetical protein